MPARKLAETTKEEKSPQGLRRSSRKRSSSVSNKEPEKKADQPASKKQKTSSKASTTGKKPTKANDDNDDKKARPSGGTHGSKHDTNEAPAKQASKDRLPKKGQKCFWKAMPGWVEGHVEEILTSSKTVNGKKVNASESDPRIVLRSHGPSGKIAVHKVGVCYFDD